MDSNPITADMCRVCLKSDNITDQFLKISDTHEGRPIVEHLKQMSSKLKLTMEPNLPSMLCPQCLEMLLECNRFREQAEKTDKYLRTINNKRKREKSNIDQVIVMYVEDVKEESSVLQSDVSDTEPTETTDEPMKSLDIKEEAFKSEDELPLQVKIEEKDNGNKEQKHKAKLKRGRAKKPTTKGSESAEKDESTRPKRSRKPEILEEIDDGKFYCCKCPVYFDVEAQTLNHYQSTHLLENKAPLIPKINIKKRFEFECKMCSTTCKTLCKLKLHQKQFQHTKQCTECGLFVPRNKFEYHVSRHLPESERMNNQVECDVCHKKLYSKMGLKRHLETHGNDYKYKCDECGRMFKTEPTWRGHMKQHELKRKGKTIQCPVCPAAFHLPNGLELHMRTHSGEKPFECTFCDMKYADRSDLRRHIWMHTGESPYRCKRCDKMFIRKDYLLKHQASCNAWPQSTAGLSSQGMF